MLRRRTLMIAALLFGGYALATWGFFLLLAEPGDGPDPLDPKG